LVAWVGPEFSWMIGAMHSARKPALGSESVMTTVWSSGASTLAMLFPSSALSGFVWSAVCPR